MIEFLKDIAAVWDLLSVRFPWLAAALTVLGTSPWVAYAVVQCTKLYRREFGLRKLKRVELRLLGGTIAAVWGFRAAVVWHDLPFDEAVMLALLVGFMTPYLVAVYFRCIEKRDAELAEKLAIPRRRAGERERDPNDDTGEFRL